MNDKNITINFASEKKFRTIEIQKKKQLYFATDANGVKWQFRSDIYRYAF